MVQPAGRENWQTLVIQKVPRELADCSLEQCRDICRYVIWWTSKLIRDVGADSRAKIGGRTCRDCGREPRKQTIPSKKLTPKKYNGHEEVESDFDSPVINQEWYQADNLSEFELWSRTPNLNCGDGAPNWFGHFPGMGHPYWKDNPWNGPFSWPCRSNEKLIWGRSPIDLYWQIGSPWNNRPDGPTEEGIPGWAFCPPPEIGTWTRTTPQKKPLTMLTFDPHHRPHKIIRSSLREGRVRSSRTDVREIPTPYWVPVRSSSSCLFTSETSTQRPKLISNFNLIYFFPVFGDGAPK